MKKKINRVSVCAVAAAASLFTTSFSAMGAGAGVGGWRQENEKWKYYDGIRDLADRMGQKRK